jgi:hypothetical protein
LFDDDKDEADDVIEAVDAVVVSVVVVNERNSPSSMEKSLVGVFVIA